MRFGAAGENDEQMRLLAKERRKLLNAVHSNQKRLDCLDYLIFKIKKRNT